MDRIALAFLVCASLVACDRSNLPIDDAGTTTTVSRDLAPLQPDFASGCGDGVCGAGETCSNCSVDCGLCASCGDHTCSSDESCTTCPEDCGECAKCGDGYCTVGENCENCAPDCGECQKCGDNHCQSPEEDCFTCPQDCGKCKGCGDGVCSFGETCDSCPTDCGVCSVCGNMKCEDPYETCVNCPGDCGPCAAVGCGQMLTCALGCIDLSTMPPSVSPSCVATCVARGCADAQYFFDQVFNCLIGALIKGGGIGAAMTACDAQVKACFASKCK